MTKRKKLSIFPIKRQLQCREGRQWKITGLTTFDVEYRGQTARVEALVSPTLEDGIFLGWATLRDLISGPNRDHIHFDNYPKTPSIKLRRDVLEPTISQQNADAIRLKEFIRRQKYMPNKSCGGCGEDKTHHSREDCPNRNKRCYNCGKIGHVRDVCRSNPIIRKDERQEQMLVDLTRQLRDSIWRAESDQLN